MPKECEGTKWKNSFVPKNGSKEKAKFKIDTEDANGNFTGKFQEDGMSGYDTITGNCSASRIWFHRPTTARTYLYDGIFIYEGGEKKYIEGTRSEVSLLASDAEKKFKEGKPLRPPPDDWVAEKDPT